MSYGPAMGAYDEHGPLSTRRRQHASSGSPNARSDSAGTHWCVSPLSGHHPSGQ